MNNPQFPTEKNPLEVFSCGTVYEEGILKVSVWYA